MQPLMMFRDNTNAAKAVNYITLLAGWESPFLVLSPFCCLLIRIAYSCAPQGNQTSKLHCIVETRVSLTSEPGVSEHDKNQHHLSVSFSCGHTIPWLLLSSLH